MTLLKLTNVSLAYGNNPLLDGVSWQIARGERVCIIGRNGTGKSSMLSLVKGSQLPDDGEIWRAPGLNSPDQSGILPTSPGPIIFWSAPGRDFPDQSGFFRTKPDLFRPSPELGFLRW